MLCDLAIAHAVRRLVWITLIIFCFNTRIAFSPPDVGYGFMVYIGCFRFVKDITNFLEKLITWPRECGEYHTDINNNINQHPNEVWDLSCRTRNWGLCHSVPNALLIGGVVVLGRVCIRVVLGPIRTVRGLT